ncbi:MAG: serine--tRNA ligase, partial [Elusimicrobiota bacterium]|nr:serine--tRNA ligase [Elusimicrobiota bacterium]
MIDINLIRTNKKWVEEKLSLRGQKIDLSNIISLDEKRRQLQQQADTLRNKRKLLSEEIGKLKKQNKPVDDLLKEVEEIKTHITSIESELGKIEDNLFTELLYIPNIPDETVPKGASSEDNKVVYQSAEIPRYNFDPLPHWEVGKNLDILDFDKMAKISGSRFVILKG